MLQRSRSLKNAFLAERLARLAPDERHGLGELDRAPRTAPGRGRVMTRAARRRPPDVQLAADPELPALLHRPAHLGLGHLDADGGPGVAGPAPHRERRRPRASSSGLQFLPMLLFGPFGGLVADRMNKRRLLYVTQTAGGLLALVLGLLVVSRRRPAVAGLPAGRVARGGQRLRQPGPPDLRHGDGGPGRPAQCREPQHRGDERLAGGRVRPSAAWSSPWSDWGPASSSTPPRTSPSIVGLSMMRSAELHPDGAGGTGQGPDPRGLPLRLAHPRPPQHPPGHRPHRHLRLQLHRDPGPVGQGAPSTAGPVPTRSSPRAWASGRWSAG